MKNEVNKECTDWPLARTEIREPDLYRVVVHNDDFTPMEFVIDMLEKFFDIGRKGAICVMMEAHLKGQAAFGIFTKDIASSKIVKVMDYAKLEKHPLRCSMEAIT